ncbi:MAG: AraC family transcriptional regulator [Nevskiaceae bacterium]|nr:MAG: AraC family transcriptional regulator [Nevskiaceae bacterium]TAM27036.1 MAG: AraC family transcriptional regulator [Nevskiaceae bacterium]
MAAQQRANGREDPARLVRQGATIYYWRRGILLLAPSLVLDRATSPLTATLRIACEAPYLIEVEGQTLTTRASLVAPRAERRRVVAVNSYIALFYFPLEMSEYAGIKEVLAGQAIIELPFEPFEPLLPDLRLAMTGDLPVNRARALIDAAVEAITGRRMPTYPQRDPRIDTACALIDQLPLDEVRLDTLARRVNLSESRLRELFKLQVGCTIGEYARWRSIWHMTSHWQEGRTFTELAVDAGFHDLAHADRVFLETFGISPSSVIDSRYFKLVPCE